MSRELRLKPVYFLGHLHALWHNVLEQQEDGDLSSWSDETIASFSCYSGNAPQYISLLRKFGWLDGYLIHDWLDYAGLYLIKKYSTSNRNKLVEIWSKHGRVYGEDLIKRSARRVTPEVSEQKANLPNLTLPNQPTYQKQAFFSQNETEKLEKLLCESFKYTKGSLALGVRLQELWLKSHDKDSPVAYAIACIVGEKKDSKL